ncbi:MAG: DUF885 domain-containing protein [Terricaulis sp.]
MRFTLALVATFLAAPILCFGSVAKAQEGGHAELVDLFREWRAFVEPAIVNGAPDYSATAIARQRRGLISFQRRLRAIDASAGPIPERIDHRLVMAEMNGLDFDIRVRQPWARDPAFYMNVHSEYGDVPDHEGPSAHPQIDLWSLPYPLSEDDARQLAVQLRMIPPMLDQARRNLAHGNARDLWIGGVREIQAQAELLASLEAGTLQVSDLEGRRLATLGGHGSEVAAAADEARAATSAFADWVAREAESKTGPSGVGRENYTWYLRNVHLSPYTWEEEVTLLRRELGRAHAALRLEEHRNRALPLLEPSANAEAHARRSDEHLRKFVDFLTRAGMLPDERYTEPALRAQIGDFAPPEQRGFFAQASHREPMTMYAHSIHWVELARMRERPHQSPIRREAALSNIFDNRSEGLATAFEEMVMHAGLYDDNPRAREIVWIMLAQRAARGLASLYAHANEMTLTEARAFQAAWTPRGWMVSDPALAAWEQLFYLRQPGYGTSYVTGKIQFDALIAAHGRAAEARGERPELGDLFTAIADAGIIPVSMLVWELTGNEHGGDPIASP